MKTALYGVLKDSRVREVKFCERVQTISRKLVLKAELFH